jgi:hypothetical protein
MAARTWAPGSAVCCLSPETAHGARNDHEANSAANLCLSLFFLAFVWRKRSRRTYRRALMSSSAGAYQSPDQRSREFKDHRRQADAWIGCDRGMGTNPCRETLPRRKYIGRLSSVQNRSWDSLSYKEEGTRRRTSSSRLVTDGLSHF